MKPSITSEEVGSWTDLQFARYFDDALQAIETNPLKNFVEHPLFMNLTPTAAQRVALKCVFGMPLDPVTQHAVSIEEASEQGGFKLAVRFMTEVELYELMTEEPYELDPSVVKNRIDMIIGRRGGKTLISSIISIYYAIKTNWKPYLTKTPAATVAILSHTKELSEEILELIKELVEASPILARLKDASKKETQSTFNLVVPFAKATISPEGKREWQVEYSRVTVKVGAASKKTIRGRAICALLCDEIAFWNLDEAAAETDEEILRAARPSLLQFKDQSILLKLSSPGIKQGVLYNEWKSKHELPASYLCFKAPSWVWNTLLESKYFEEEYKVDPTGFGSEYRADFVDSISNFILPEFVDFCTMRGVAFNPPEAKSDLVYSAAIDAAFKGDRFTFSLVGLQDGGKIKQYVMKDWQGSRKAPVKATEIAQYIRNVCRQYGISRVFADQYSFQPLKEIFDQFGITLIEDPFTNERKKKIFFHLKKLIHNQQADLLDHPQLLTEIKQLQVEQTTTGTVRIGHPPGGHDDCATAFALAAFQVVESGTSAGIEVGEIAGDNPYGIVTDVTGKTFVAPSPEMLREQFGGPVFDNAGLYRKNPETGEWELNLGEEDDEEGPNEGPDFLF